VTLTKRYERICALTNAKYCELTISRNNDGLFLIEAGPLNGEST
jgi:hypothetical protein